MQPTVLPPPRFVPVAVTVVFTVRTNAVGKALIVQPPLAAVTRDTARIRKTIATTAT